MVADNQQKLLQQQQNTMMLDVYWQAMNLGFHKSNDDANASLAVLSLYLEILHQYF